MHYRIGQDHFTAHTNTIITTIEPWVRISLTPEGTVAEPAFSLSGNEGDTVRCSFDLRNTGNTSNAVVVGSLLIPPSTLGVEDVSFFNDLNGNQELDAGEEDPTFLNLDPGEGVDLGTRIVLSSDRGGGESYLEIHATAIHDTIQYRDASVISVITRPDSAAPLHLGPVDNARALPGGDGSPDDVTRSSVGFNDRTVVFENDVLNEGGVSDVIQIEPADSAGWPPGVEVTVEDSVGNRFGPSPLDGGAALLGQIGAGEKRTFRVRVAASSQSFYPLFDDSLSIGIRARSLLDTARVNDTTDRVILAETFNPNAVISLEQTFKENAAAFGDIVTLITTVTNRSDSLRVTDVVVRETIQPTLDFMSSPVFELDGGDAVWTIGRLEPGERRQTVIKFVTNSRQSRGWTQVVGNATGTALEEDVYAGPVVNALRVANDVFADEGMVLGDVFIDTNENGKRDSGERGIPNAAVFVESGEYALTDSTGRFTIPYVFSGYRIVRLDESTLPPTDVDLQAIDGQSVYPFSTERVVHLIPSGHASVSFPLPGKTEVPNRVTRRVDCQEMIVLQKRQQALYQMPSIPSSLFETGKAYIKTGNLHLLDPISDFLNTHPGWMVFLEGHTDSIPIHNEEFLSNEALSVARAEAVMRYLTANGVPERRIVVRGHGAERPIATNSTRDGRARNRRVEVSFVPPATNLDNELELLRVQSDLQSVGTVVDTFRVTLVWVLSTDSNGPFDVGLSFDIPEPIGTASVHVMCGETEVPSHAKNRYIIEGFAKSRGIECEIAFLATEADTHLIRDIRSKIDFVSPESHEKPVVPGTRAVVRGAVGAGVGDERTGPDGKTGTSGGVPIVSVPGTPVGPSLPDSQIVLRPYGQGNSNKETQYFTLCAWDEEEDPQGRGIGGDLKPGREDRGVRRGAEGRAHTGEREGSPGSVDGGSSGEVKELGLIEPTDRSVVSRKDQIDVVARVPLGSSYSLFSNGQPISEERIGQKVIHLKLGFEEITYYGVKIASGWNTILLDAQPVNGPNDLVDSVRVALAGQPTVLALTPERLVVPADGRSSGVIRVELLDELGFPTVNGLVATISEGDSIVTNVDQDPDHRGIQITSEDGLFLVRIRPTTVTGRGRVVIESHGLTASCNVAFVPPRRPMFVSGILEARLGAFNASGTGDPFGLDNYYDGLDLDGESRFFIQGTTYAGINLTARVDTENRYDDPLLKTYNPERQYTIYGDASEVYSAAPAQGGNYVALEKGQSYLRYGDFRSPLTEGEFLTYRKTETGLLGTIASGENSVGAFVTKTDLFTVQDEIPGDGTSGYYYLSQSPVVENSVNLVLQVRDRFQPEKILKIQPLVEHRDYTVNYFNGALLFKEPVPVTTREFNPITIVAIYEAKSSEEGDYLYGVRGDVGGDGEVGRYRLGASAVAKDGSDADYALYGVDGTFSVGWLDLSGEYARSEEDITGEGDAYKLQLGTKKLRGEHSLYMRKVDGKFQNPSFTGSAHELFSEKLGFDSHLDITNGLSLDSRGYRHRFTNTGEKDDNIDLFGKYENTLFMLGAGIRAAGQENEIGNKRSLLSILGAGVRAGKHVDFRTHWERNHRDDVVDDFPDRLRSALSVGILQKYKIIATHEYLSAHDRPATHQLLAGVEKRTGEGSKVYTKYALNRTANDQRVGTIAGFRQKVTLKSNIMGTLDVEGFRSFSNNVEDEYVAFKTGLTHLTKGESLLEGQYEYRWQRAVDRHLFKINAMKEFDNGLSVLLKDAFSVATCDDKDTSLRTEGRLAGAYRPVASRFWTLLMLKTAYDRYTPVDPEAITWKTVLSTDFNFMPMPAHELRLKLAVKRVEDFSTHISETSRNYLVLSQYVYRFADDWDVDLWGRFLGRVDAGTRQTGAGIEIGRILHNRVRVAAGYSIGGFEDRDLSENAVWENGFGLRVQLILSDWMFNDYQF